jgi:DivIVA domain
VSTFPRSPKSKPGYDVAQVDEFLVSARRAYDSDPSTPGALTASDIRHTAFSMAKGGYSTSHVDAALERLEDAFAARERENARGGGRDSSWFEDARTSAQAILDRLERRWATASSG